MATLWGGRLSPLSPRGRGGNHPKGLLGLLLGFALGALSGCGAPPLPSPPKDDTLRVAIHTDIHTLDPAVNLEAIGMTYVRLMYESLLDYGDGTDLIPWLAEEVPTPSEDGKTYTFKIKKGVHFTSGRELTAEDFLYTFERIFDPRTKSPGGDYYGGILGADAYQKARDEEANQANSDEAKKERRKKGERWEEPIHLEGVRAVDPHTLTITLEKPDPTFLYVLTMPLCAPVPRESVEKYGEDFGSHPDGTGPYVLTEWRRGARLVFERKKEHHVRRDRSLQRIEVLVGPDNVTGQMMFERGQLDLIYTIPAADFVRLSRDPHWKNCLGSLPGITTNYLVLNCELEPFTNPKVRQAISHAINKQRIVRMMNNQVIVAEGLLPPLMPGYNPELKGYPYDPQKAKRLLAEAGYPNGFHMPLWVPTDNDDRRKTAASIQQDLRDIGIDAELKEVAGGIFDEATSKRKEVPACVYGWSQDYPDPSDFLEKLYSGDAIRETHSNNLSFYSNPEVNELLKKAADETDSSRRLRYYQEAEAKIVADAPCVFLNYPIDNRLVQPWVKGYKMHPVWTVRYEFLWIERP